MIKYTIDKSLMGGRGNPSCQEFKVSGLRSLGDHKVILPQGRVPTRSHSWEVTILGGHTAGLGIQLGWREQEGKSCHNTGQAQWLHGGLTLGGGLGGPVAPKGA